MDTTNNNEKQSKRISRTCPLETDVVLNSRYQVVKKIGSGRFSTVWLVHDIHTDLSYAIKVFKRGSDYKEYFDNELLIYKSLPKHQYIQKLYDYFIHIDYVGETVTDSRHDSSTHLYPCLVFESEEIA